MQSLICNIKSSQKYHIYIVTRNINFVDISYLKIFEKENIKIHFINADDIFEKTKNLFIDRHLSIAAYWRYFLPYIIPNIEKIVYIDCDTIICDDIQKLYNIDIRNNFIAGCVDIAVNQCDFGDFKLAKDKLSLFDFNEFSKYINSGVLVINIKKWKEERISEKLLDISKQNKFIFHDQDALNIICKDKIYYLSERWNFTTHVAPEIYSISTQNNMQNRILNWDIGIIHYPGKFKPWNSYQGLLVNIWFMYANINPFFCNEKKISKFNIKQYYFIVKCFIKKRCPEKIWNKLMFIKSSFRYYCIYKIKNTIKNK